jgi:hypothetical protein
MTGPPWGSPQIDIALGSVEVTDTDRRAVYWRVEVDGDDPVTGGRKAGRDACRQYLRDYGQKGLDELVSEYLQAGGKTAGMEAQERKA